MNMNDAAPPAMRLLRGNSTLPDGAAAATSASTVNDPVSVLRAMAEHRREMTSLPESMQAGDWFNLDPRAAVDTPGVHPVMRAVLRRKDGDGRKRFAAAVRRTCERLAEVPVGTFASCDSEQVLAFPWHHLTVEAAAEYRVQIYRQFDKQGTRNDTIVALRAVLKQCYQVGLISMLRYQRLLDELYTVAPGPSTRRRRLTEAEIAALMTACATVGSAAARARNTAIVAIFVTTGMRIGELCAIELDDWDQADGTIRLRGTKNGFDHVVFVHPAALPYLQQWLSVRGTSPGALFSSVLAHAEYSSITMAGVRYMLRSRAQAAGVAPFGSHDFRRTFATTQLRLHDVALVSKLLNHRDMRATMIYDMASEDEQRAAVGKLHLPASDSLLPAVDAPQPNDPIDQAG